MFLILFLPFFFVCVCVVYFGLVLFSGKAGERVLKQTLIGLSFDEREISASCVE